jgi:hypothetical protein
MKTNLHFILVAVCAAGVLTLAAPAQQTGTTSGTTSNTGAGATAGDRSSSATTGAAALQDPEELFRKLDADKNERLTRMEFQRIAALVKEDPGASGRTGTPGTTGARSTDSANPSRTGDARTPDQSERSTTGRSSDTAGTARSGSASGTAGTTGTTGNTATGSAATVSIENPDALFRQLDTDRDDTLSRPESRALLASQGAAAARGPLAPAPAAVAAAVPPPAPAHPRHAESHLLALRDEDRPARSAAPVLNPPATTPI